MTTGLRYQGKVVIVTGGTGGIGSAMVREFARQGSKVVFCAPKSEAEKGQVLQKEIQDSGCAGEGYFQVCDLRIDSDIQRLVRVTIERYGRLDCLVNNAAELFPLAKVDDATIQDFLNFVQLNVFGVFLGSKYALPCLRRTKGNIINIGSLYVDLGFPNAVAYASTKAAVISMTKSMAISESQYGVRVNCISPSNIWTGMWRRYANLTPNPEATIQEGKDYQLMGRFGTPEEVALATLFLAANGTFCTGLNLVLSGGAELGFAKKSQVDAKPGPSSSGSSQGGGDFMVPAWAGEKS
ncbi:17-beta-hydroxysteroid dehydrogenase 14-like [Eublepharis macularius]|uniref:17-beta-hydroxysteroid dehydrogenase 14-like n=1 Tax=Eublepharis macularius TaxID=481883 RepID=A0AA97K7M5_EUBMA|nr:17-beta-hydroxysteroid dehydrogenase 14-like [Eublepharis macularius]